LISPKNLVTPSASKNGRRTARAFAPAMPRNRKSKTTTTPARRKKASTSKVAVTSSVFEASADFSAEFQRAFNAGIKKKKKRIIRDGPMTITFYE
jgi:hypothetical protein